MAKTLTATFDGQVLRPDSVLDLEPNTGYIVTIEEIAPETMGGDAWEVLEALTGTVEAPTDWAIEHDHYLYGTPKRQHDQHPEQKE